MGAAKSYSLGGPDATSAKWNGRSPWSCTSQYLALNRFSAPRVERPPLVARSEFALLTPTRATCAPAPHTCSAAVLALSLSLREISSCRLRWVEGVELVWGRSRAVLALSLSLREISSCRLRWVEGVDLAWGRGRNPQRRPCHECRTKRTPCSKSARRRRRSLRSCTPGTRSAKRRGRESSELHEPVRRLNSMQRFARQSFCRTRRRCLEPFCGGTSVQRVRDEEDASPRSCTNQYSDCSRFSATCVNLPVRSKEQAGALLRSWASQQFSAKRVNHLQSCTDQYVALNRFSASRVTRQATTRTQSFIACATAQRPPELAPSTAVPTPPPTWSALKPLPVSSPETSDRPSHRSLVQLSVGCAVKSEVPAAITPVRLRSPWKRSDIEGEKVMKKTCRIDAGVPYTASRWGPQRRTATPSETLSVPGNSSEFHMLSTPPARLGEVQRGTLAGRGPLLLLSSIQSVVFPTHLSTNASTESRLWARSPGGARCTGPLLPAESRGITAST